MDSNISVLKDISNVNCLSAKKSRKRMKDGSLKEYVHERKARKTIDLTFDSEADLLKFDSKFDNMKKRMDIKSNAECLIRLMEHVDRQDKPVQETEIPNQNMSASKVSDRDVDDDLFICSKAQLFKLVMLLNNIGQCDVSSFSKIGHVGQMSLQTDTNVFIWNSSSPLHDDFSVNYKAIHAYLCSGILPCQYEKFAEFMNIGLHKQDFRKNTVNMYSTVVNTLKEESIKQATEEEESKTNEATSKGIGIMTDARHACRKNSFHSDVLALGINTHKVVGHVHITKDEERSSQKHELYGTKRLYENFERQNVKILEHAHDRNMSISKFLAEDQPAVRDSFDTWHSTKEIRKSVSKITKGARKNIGVTWHPDLSDKGAGIKTHIYWAMKNCQGQANEIVSAMDNIEAHYQNQHGGCHQTSNCKTPGYIPSRTIIRAPAAVDLLRKTIQGLFIYKNPGKYVKCRDTHYVVSCNNTFLIYIDKRIHYGVTMYNIRAALAILDWNEHVDRPTTSVSLQVRADHPRRRSPKRILAPKTFRFVKELWQRFKGGLQADGIIPVANVNNSDSESDSDQDSDED